MLQFNSFFSICIVYFLHHILKMSSNSSNGTGLLENIASTQQVQSKANEDVLVFFSSLIGGVAVALFEIAVFLLLKEVLPRI